MRQLPSAFLLRRRWHTVAAIITIVIVAMWFQKWSLDGLEGVVLSALLREDTSYAKGYTDRAFRSIRVGMPDQHIETLLGPPLVVTFSYRTTRSQGCTLVRFMDGKVRSWLFDECEKRGIRTGLPIQGAAAVLGEPDEVYWIYSESPTSTQYRQRIVRLSGGRVVEIVTGWYLD